MAFIGPDEFLVLQKADGQVRHVVSGVLQPGNVLDVNVKSSSERGLLGIAVNPNDSTDVFLYYTEASGSDGGTALGNRIYRYTWNPQTQQLGSPSLVLDLPVTLGPNHDGGILLCERVDASTVYLYSVIGDLNRQGQMQNITFGEPADNTGGILRTLLDGTPAPGNPFEAYCSQTTATLCANDGECPNGETCITEVERYFAYGVRNSFGMAFDPVTGFLWDTENGPGTYDEINRVPAGFNSGWRQIMGPDARDPQGTGDLFHMPGAGITYSDPEFSWLDTTAPTSILFPVGSSLGAAYEDVALVGDNNSGQIFALPLNAGRTAFDLSAWVDLTDLVADDNGERDLLSLGTGFGVVTDIKMGPDGDLYVVSLNQGAVHRISGPGPVSVPERFGANGFRLSQNHPNPFTTHTRIAYEVSRRGLPVTLEIYDVTGRLVRRLASTHSVHGPQTGLWDGKDGNGRRVAAGLYTCRLTVAGVSETRKMIRIR
jgi:glucose/arabinose dehydrogenase